MKNEPDYVNTFILNNLSRGYTQIEISSMLKEKGITPNSQSTIDKKVKKMIKDNGYRSLCQLMYWRGKGTDLIY